MGYRRESHLLYFLKGRKEKKEYCSNTFKYSMKAARMGMNTWMATKTEVLCGKRAQLRRAEDISVF